LSALFTANPYISCQPATVEQFLPLYRGTLASSDQRLLSLFQLFESYRHISTSSVLASWSGGPGQSARPFDALTSLEPGKMLATALNFPLRKTLRGVHEVTGNDAGEGLYDPAFVMALFASALATEMTGLDWVEILRTNVLGVAMAALSSRDHEMRSMAGYVLSATTSYLDVRLAILGMIHADVQRVAFQEKPQLVHILRLVRYSIPAPSSASHPRLPVLISSFLAHVLRSLASPSSPLYPTTSRFLLQRPTLDTQDVPMLFGMLYASGEGHRRDRSWIVRLIKDATRSEAVSLACT
jgi:nucleolar pre-ribosomal-associated protein 1